MSTLFSTKKIDTQSTENNQSRDSAPIPLDMYRSKDKLIILAPIAGISIEDITVSVTEDILTMKGVRNNPEEIPDKDYFSRECFWGEFSRSVVLPVGVDIDKVTALYRGGILRVEMPISGEEQVRVIPISMEED